MKLTSGLYFFSGTSLELNNVRLQSLLFVTPLAMQALLDILTWSVSKALEFDKDESDHLKAYFTERAVITGIIALRMFW